MTDKRQIVGPVLRKPEVPTSREGEEWAWEGGYFSPGKHHGISPLYAVRRLNALEADLRREREAHAVTGLSERFYQESLAQAQADLATLRARLAAHPTPQTEAPATGTGA